ncbi:MAG: PIG-L family deacetylase [Candidatus Omnitrophica bacterium]|nr:PIG-L family deacetylase [Candidatus Omnitrophota bacterium]
MQKILVVSVHPDDETLGCAGTLLRLRSQGAQISWLILTQMGKDKFSKETIEGRSKEIQVVSKIYGMNDVKVLRFETTNLVQVPLNDLVQEISEVVNQLQPDTVFIPNRSDAHSDHRRAFEALSVLVKGFRYPYIKNVLMYETISETEFAPALPEKIFIPNMFVEVTHFIQKKIEIMRIYSSELGQHPFPRSERNILALATFRGATANVEYAESFMVLKFQI